MDICDVLPPVAKKKQDIKLEGTVDISELDFQLQGQAAITPTENYLVIRPAPADVAQAEFQPQLEFDGMAKPSFAITLEENLSEIEQYTFKNAPTLLESLEAQKIEVPYQCRDGYCGACRCKKITGEVSYLKEPMAWINDDEILPCVSIPTSDLHLKIG